MIADLFKYGTVIDVNDSLDGDRVRIHIKGVDPSKFSVNDIPYAFPLLPKTFHCKPKVGEIVLVFTKTGSYDDDRFWIGPIISQPHKIEYDTISALSFLSPGLINPDTPPSTDPNNVGVNMDSEDIGLQGRGSTDVILKPDEIRIRAGKSLDYRTLNQVNPSYIQIKFDKSANESNINLVADNINILSHKGLENFNLNDPNNLISDEEYSKILEKAHQLPFGDVLIEFLNIFIKAFTSHVHAYHGLPPDLKQTEVKTLIAYELNKILSNNIRIN